MPSGEFMDDWRSGKHAILSFSFTVSGGVAGSIAATWLGSSACGALVTPIRSLPQVLHHLDTPDIYLNFGHFPADC
jgi:hypothetical protein